MGVINHGIKIGPIIKINMLVMPIKIIAERKITSFCSLIPFRFKSFFFFRSQLIIETKKDVPSIINKRSNEPKTIIIEAAKLALTENKTSGITTHVQLKRPEPPPSAPNRK